MHGKHPSTKNIFKRDPETRFKTLSMYEWSSPVFELLADTLWWAEEKIDGTNTRVHWDGRTGFKFAGRSDKAQMQPQQDEALVALFNDEMVERFVKNAVPSITIYGECFGRGIQKGGHYGHPQFRMFDVLYTSQRGVGRYWERTQVWDLSYNNEIPVAPLLGKWDLHEAVVRTTTGIPSLTAKHHLSDLEGFNPETVQLPMSEGVIMRPEVELRDGFGERVILKIKTKDFPDSFAEEVSKSELDFHIP